MIAIRSRLAQTTTSVSRGQNVFDLSIHLIQGDVLQMPDIAPGDQPQLRAIPGQAINAGIQNVEIARLRQHHIFGVTINAIEETAMTDDGDPAMSGVGKYALQ